jgi:hypothetical protein
MAVLPRDLVQAPGPVLEMYVPFSGVLRISLRPILEAMGEMGRVEGRAGLATTRLRQFI